jgi:2-succinyl-6-hydroxy-2,4-cyclohexadiene-1-carboxylate synthase
MPVATIRGLEIHYREKGEGFPVVLVHGFTGNSRNWALTVPVLTRQFRTISVDLRGHGHSAKPVRKEDYALEAMAGDVYELLLHLGVRECYLAGHSMGGMVAQHIVLEHPELVRALVLVDTAAEIPEGMASRERRSERERLVEVAREKGMEAVFDEQLLANPLRERIETNPEFLRTWREQFLLTSREAYMYCAHGMASREPLIGELGRVGVPTLVVCGENDEPFLDASRKMHAAIPGSRLEVIAGAGHTPQIETPTAFNGVLMGFLLKVQEVAAA